MHRIEPERTGTTRLPDGRALAWAEWGPEDGHPVILCPGAATSRRLGFGEAVVHELGVRLVSVDRPGLGASDPAPGRTLLDWPNDLQAIELDSPAAVGFSQGAPFALACAAAGAVSAVAVVSGTDELAHPSFRDGLDDQLRGMVEDPEGAEPMFLSMDAETMRDMTQRMSGEADRAVYDNPQFTLALEEGFAQGAEGYARDTVLAMSRWPFEPAAIEVPVDLWYGGGDTSPVHSPDHGATLERRLPGSRRHLIPDAGGALLWTHSRAILEKLLEAVKTGR